jgi:uncharacterized metal-binding protein
MPNGRTHNAVSLLAAGHLTAVSAYLITAGATTPWVFCTVGGALTGLLLSPDLDVDNGNISDAIIRRRLGCVIESLWHFYWSPYAKIIPHRGWLSHTPVVGTTIRVVYAFWWIFLLAPQIVVSEGFWYWFAGLALVDAYHWFLDIAT